MAIVLVVGGAGFIGSHLVEALLGRNHRVRVLDDLSTGSLGNLRMGAGRAPVRSAGDRSTVRSQLDFVYGDVRDAETVRKAVRGAEYVYHLAARSTNGQSLGSPAEVTSVNVDGTLNVLRAAHAEGVGRLVYASSWSVYGDGHPLPLAEDVLPRPRSPYAASKAAGEAYCRAYWETYGVETICLRYFNVYGPLQSASSEVAAVVPRFVLALLEGTRPAVHGDGRQTRDFVFVDDAVRATLAAAEAPGAAGRCANVASGRMSSVLHLLRTLGSVVGRETTPRFAPPKPWDIRHSVGDTTLAKSLLDFAAQISLAEGLARTVAYYREALREDEVRPVGIAPHA